MMWKSLICVAATLVATLLGGQEQVPRAGATIPDGQVAVGAAPGGRYTIARPLKEKYDELVSRTRELKARIVGREIDEESAHESLVELQKELRETAAEIERTKELLTAAKVHTARTQFDFEPGPERNLVILASRVRVVGWDEPRVRCVLEKTVLSVAGEGVDEHLEGIRVAHRHGVSPEVVGYTEEEHVRSLRGDAAELSPLAKRILHEKAEKFAPFAALQGEAVDVVEVSGLTHDQGNRQITIELRGASGGSLWSEWRRHASLTLFVPALRNVGIRGGREGVDVESLDGSLAIVGEGDVDYSARSRAVDISGGVTAHEISLDVLDRIGGSVSVRQTAYKENAASTSRGNARTAFSGAPRPLEYTNIGGDLKLVLTRADLRIEGVSGNVDVRNEFGTTTFVAAQPLAASSHRFVSESGVIDITIPKASAAERTLVAMTECGTVTCINASPELLEDRNITAFTEPGPARRSWKGFTSRIEIFDLFGLVDRINLSLKGEENAGGFDVVSRGGSVRVELRD